MSVPEKKQKGESPEEYVRRISKFPALHPHTIQRVVFPASKEVSWQNLHDWAGLVFPEEFPQTDWDDYPPECLESISTKAFANWVVEENIFEAWRALGEEVSHSAELFIELVNGKAIDSKQASKKVKRNNPNITTDRGILDSFKKETFIPLVEQVIKKNPDWQNRQILAHKKVDDAIDKCGFPKGKPSESTIKKWISTARKNTGAKAKTGRPPK